MPRRVQRDAAAITQTNIAQLIDEQFDDKRDPYGKAWKPPKDGGETMVRSGRLRRGFVVRVKPGTGQGLAIEISNREAYAKWLQEGTDRMEPRRLVPGAVLPDSWKRVMKEAYVQALDEWFARSPK